MSAAHVARATDEHGARNATALLAAVLLSVLFLLASSADRTGDAGSTRLPQGGAEPRLESEAERPPPTPEPGLDR